MKVDSSNSFCLVKDDVIFCPAAQNKDIAPEVDQLYLSTLIAEASDKDVKLILLKINLRESFETIFKKISVFN